jgi:hypothetical protein
MKRKPALAGEVPALLLTPTHSETSSRHLLIPFSVVERGCHPVRAAPLSFWIPRVVRRRWNRPCRLRPSEAWATGPAPSAACSRCSCSYADAEFMLGLTEWVLPSVQHYRPRDVVLDGSIAA